MKQLSREEYNIISFWSGDIEHWDKNIEIMDLLTEDQKRKAFEIIMRKEE